MHHNNFFHNYYHNDYNNDDTDDNDFTIYLEIILHIIDLFK